MTGDTTDHATLLLHLGHAADSHVGLRREENQDFHGIIAGDSYRLFLVADGMGGVKGGAIASHLAVDTIREKLAGRAEIDEQALTDAMLAANEAIFNAGAEQPELSGMGTTLVGLAFTHDRLLVLNIGDSRAYRIRADEIVQLTDDHTVVGELLRSGAITREQAASSPVSHMLTRSLGPVAEAHPDVIPVDAPQAGDDYLLCSDGLYNLVNEEEIFTVLRAEEPAEAVKKLISLANQRGGTDNITIVVVRVAADYHRGTEEPVAADAPAGVVGGADEEAGEGSVKIQPKVSLDSLSEAQQEAFRRVLLEVQRQAAMAAPAAKTVRENAAERDARRLGWALPAGGVAVGALLIISVYALRSPLPPPAVKEIAVVAENSPSALTDTVTPTPHPVAQLPAAGPEVSRPGQNRQGDSQESVGRRERESILERKRAASQAIERIDQKLSLLVQGLSKEEGTAAIEHARQYQLETEKALHSMKAEIDSATRKLGIWYKRLNRLKETNPLNLATEVAVSSEKVKQKKEEFESATYEYLKGVEAWKYTPSDKELEARVMALAKDRSDRMKDLSEEVSRAVREMIEESDREIGELTLKREKLEAELIDAQYGTRSVEAVLNQDEGAKRRLQDELEAKKELLGAELQELEALMPHGLHPENPDPGLAG